MYGDKIAFVHIMKAGGTFLHSYLTQNVLREYTVKSLWDQGITRDWTRGELLTFCYGNERNIYVHNHSVNWDREVIQQYHFNGWKTFAFIREVGDQLCSLYHFLDEHIAPCFLKIKPISEEIDIDEFIVRQLTSQTVFPTVPDYTINFHHWKIPGFYKELTYINEVSAESFRHFLKVFFDHDYDPSLASEAKKNIKIQSLQKSMNKGYRHYLEKGMITSKTDKLLKKSLFYERYLEAREWITNRLCETSGAAENSNRMV